VNEGRQGEGRRESAQVANPAAVSAVALMYTVNHKKRGSLLSTITLANFNRFL